MSTQYEILAELCLPTCDLTADLAFFSDTLGMRLDLIFPADDPSVAVFSGHGLRLRLERKTGHANSLRILTDDRSFADGATSLTSPGGIPVEIHPLNPPLEIPDTQHQFVVRRLADQAPWIIGRAGMHYRDLIPDRLGGSIIASHIRIPDGGPVPDMVHFHKVGFQLIFCLRGWVDVVYEDQGQPMRLTAGDCFIQPPEIRHQVLEASDGIEVIEIGMPAEHITEIDHQMKLPTPHFRPERRWQGQRFVYNKAIDALWQPAQHRSGFVMRDTTVGENTQGVADVLVLRRGTGVSDWTSHHVDIHFSFVMAGNMVLECGGADHQLRAGDAFVIPPGQQTRYSAPSDDLELLEVTLPACGQA